MDLFYLWYHESRRARHGAAMFAPDYVHWEGMYEVAHRFYFEMVPEVEDAITKARTAGNEAGADKVQALLDETLNSEMHRWFLGQEPPKSWNPKDDPDNGIEHIMSKKTIAGWTENPAVTGHPHEIDCGGGRAFGRPRPSGELPASRVPE